MMIKTRFNFSTKCIKYKRNGYTVLSHYPQIRTIRKMTKTEHILRRPPGLTIDADYYDQLRPDTDLVYFEVSDGRAYAIETKVLDRTAAIIDRAGRGRQFVANFRDLVQVKPEPIGNTEIQKPIEKDTQQYQLTLFGGAK